MISLDLGQLNDKQREAVTHGDGPVLILAGAGSGKTRALTFRIAYLIKELGVKPWRIFAVTFTNKAADEMAQRVAQLAGPDYDGAHISTFHSACARILRHEAHLAGRNRNFVIYDESDQVQLLKKIIQNLALDPKKFTPRLFSHRISNAKNELKEPGDLPKEFQAGKEDPLPRVYALYQSALARNNAFDFDDLLNFTVKIFEQFPDALRRYRDRYGYILVDEFQDINLAQYRLVQLMAGESRNVWVVGDDDQSIYRWRGSSKKFLTRFEADFPERVEIKFEQNYRSTQKILEAANFVIKGNQGRKPKELWTHNPPGDAPVVLTHFTDRDEAWFAADEMLRAVGEKTAQFGQFAVLYRANAQSRLFEEAFLDRNIPYKVVGATAFYQRREIKDITAYLKCLVNPNDTVSLVRIINVPPRGIGAVTQDMVTGIMDGGAGWHELVPHLEGAGFKGRALRSVTQFLELMNKLRGETQARPAFEIVRLVLEETGYLKDLEEEDSPEAETRIENLREFVNSAKSHYIESGDGSLEGFVERITLISDVDALQGTGDMVKLMTLHCAKGLEFDRVIIAGMEEGTFPHERSSGSQEEIEEERRLCYVGITRARKALALSWCRFRMSYGVTIPMTPSRFLKEIPARCLRGAPEDMEENVSRGFRSASTPREPAMFVPAASVTFRNPKREPLKAGTFAFRVGDKVKHDRYGEGMVVSVKGTGADLELSVAFDGAGVKKFMAVFAPLKKI